MSNVAASIRLTWEANDRFPPCVDLVCRCGVEAHFCGPRWVTRADGIEEPGAVCPGCGTAWVLGGWLTATEVVQ